MLLELVIFDCDGVLVDTETIANNHVSRVFSTLGPAISGDECRRLFQGKMMEDVCKAYTTMHNLPFDPELPKMVRAQVEEAMTHGIKPIPGAVELVHRVRDSGVPFCVASSGSVAKMHKTLGQVGLLDILQDVLFSAQDIGRGKPHPDVFIAAAKAMNASCKDAVIIEDSVTGVQAGIASGARVFGYAGDPFTDAQQLADAGAVVFTDMAEFPALIGFE
jgi:HAD superfamily hydrolase (TIGR01509 family)